MMSKMVSIIVPVYNAAPYLKQCLDSLIGQSYSRIEVICVDDGSTDVSLQILKNYARKDKRVIVCSQENKGVSAARNVGLKKASGEYIMFCDSDDFYSIDTVELCMNIISRMGGCDTVLFNCQMFTKNGASFPGISNVPTGEIPAKLPGKTSEYLALFANVSFGCFSKKILDDNGIVFPEGRLYEDWEFIAHYLSFTKLTYWLNKLLYHYRVREKASNSTNITTSCLDIFYALNAIEGYYKQAGRWENVQYMHYSKSISVLYWFIKNQLPNAVPAIRHQYIASFHRYINSIPYVYFISLLCCVGIKERVELMAFHEDKTKFVSFCREKLFVLRIQREIERIKNFIKKVLRRISPTYKVSYDIRDRLLYQERIETDRFDNVLSRLDAIEREQKKLVAIIEQREQE